MHGATTLTSAQPAGHLVVHTGAYGHVSHTALRRALEAIGQADVVTLPARVNLAEAFTTYVFAEGHRPGAGYYVSHHANGRSTIIRAVVQEDSARRARLATVTLDRCTETPQLTVTFDEESMKRLSTADRTRLRAELDGVPKRFEEAKDLLPKGAVDAVVDELLQRLHGLRITDDHNTVFIPGSDAEPVEAVQRLFVTMTSDLTGPYAFDVIPLPGPLTPTMATRVTTALHERHGRTTNWIMRLLYVVGAIAKPGPEGPLEPLADAEIETRHADNLSQNFRTALDWIAAYEPVLSPEVLAPLTAQLDRCRPALAAHGLIPSTTTTASKVSNGR